MKKLLRRCYTDEGCYIYECLECHRQWEARSTGSSYCCHCGCKFEGTIDGDASPRMRRMHGWNEWPVRRVDPSVGVVVVIEYYAPCLWEDGRSSWQVVDAIHEDEVRGSMVSFVRRLKSSMLEGAWRPMLWGDEWKEDPDRLAHTRIRAISAGQVGKVYEGQVRLVKVGRNTVAQVA